MVDWNNKELKRLVVMISGKGSTLDNICRHCYEDGGLLKDIAQVVQVITNRRGIPGLAIAKKFGAVPYVVPYDGDMETRESWRKRITNCYMQPDLVIMGGFNQLIEVPPDLEGKILNVHPSLLPKFGGKGMYGHHVHEAVLTAKEKVTGCTVHLVDSEYDRGKILGQREVEIEEGDGVEELTVKVKAAERELYPQIIRNTLVSNDLCGDEV